MVVPSEPKRNISIWYLVSKIQDHGILKNGHGNVIEIYIRLGVPAL